MAPGTAPASTPPPPPSHPATLGYADAADPGNPLASPPERLKSNTHCQGDVDLNGIVNGIDFGILAANFNKGVSRWDQGDFNYDGIVNGVDFGELASNFNKGASGAAVGAPAYDDPAIVAFAQANSLMADVPEPRAFGLLGVATAGLLRRRRRAVRAGDSHFTAHFVAPFR